VKVSSRRDMVRKHGRWLIILLLGEMLTATATAQAANVVLSGVLL